MSDQDKSEIRDTLLYIVAFGGLGAIAGGHFLSGDGEYSYAAYIIIPIAYGGWHVYENDRLDWPIVVVILSWFFGGGLLVSFGIVPF